MTTGPGGNLEIALDAASGASLALSPALWFFNAPQPPAQEAKALARALELLGNGAKPIVAPTGDGDPWFDKDGKPHRVPPDQEQAAKDKGWNRAPR